MHDAKLSVGQKRGTTLHMMVRKDHINLNYNLLRHDTV
jgi:hypothetical protein